MNILLVVGGDSTERDVSLDSGKSIFEALHKLGHNVLVADPAHAEVEPTADASVFFGDASIKTEPTILTTDRYVARQNFAAVMARFQELGCEVVFNALHGGVGEDGTFQALLDYMGIRYTGSGALSCAMAMNKDLSKRLVAHSGVPVARQIFVDSSPHEQVAVDEEVMATLSLPVVVKPNQEGSSVGVTIVHTRNELSEAIEAAKVFGGPYLIEEFIAGAEVTVAVLDEQELPLLEIRPKEGFYDYRNKYQPGSCDYLVPAPLDRPTSDAIAASARSAYRALCCGGYARVDFRVRDDGAHFFLEANTLPGMTSASLFPKAARGAGIEYSNLVETILRLSIRDDALL
jgi:D-alanine-D-alanine ligase